MITFDEYQDACNRAYEPEGAIAVLKNILKRPASRANGKSTLNMITDMAICRAIVALEKETRRGHWVKHELLGCEPFYECSLCEKIHDDEYNYCNNCGAKMDGGKDDVL